MIEIDPEMSVAEIAVEYPQSVAIFEQFGIDYTCGGKSLAHVCRQQDLDLHLVLEHLHGAIRGVEEDG